jgi:transposase
MRLEWVIVMKKIDEQTKKNIIDLHIKDGLYAYEISELLNVSKPVIYDIIKKYKEENNVDIVLGTITKSKTKTAERNSIHIPDVFLKELDIKKEDKRIILFLDKNKDEKKIIIRKSKK